MTDDWVAVDAAPRNVNEFLAFSAGTPSSRSFARAARTTTPTRPARRRPRRRSSRPSRGQPGFEQVAHWSIPRARGGPIETFVYRLDLANLALDTDRIQMAPDALERMVALIEREGATELAQRLAPQVEAAPRSEATDALLARLRVLAQP